jgi:hypothetical protein
MVLFFICLIQLKIISYSFGEMDLWFREWFLGLKKKSGFYSEQGIWVIWVI